MTPDPRIAGYLAELNQQGVVSYSHLTLRRLHEWHTKEVIDDLLDAHWAATSDTSSKEEAVARILSGSATPAIDLVAMVDDGYITAREATAALQQSGRKVADVHSAAAAERDYMIRHDI